ncbi:aromatic acid exporter family protein [Pedobacter sp. L105]|uniref:FUSC family protein n=1 Tax=Pedobacter sp. L105 TaxID=1641871 RepID=UPI00131ABB13|nr:FUSC family protein [Pedobacter sp. L105]
MSKRDSIYLVKCLIGAAICCGLSFYFPQYPLYWAVISVVLVISPNRSNQFAFNYMKANLLGAVTGLGLFFLNLPDLVTILLGVTIVIFLGIVLKMMNSMRMALTGFVIVAIQGQQTRHWYIALERVSCVVSGCLIAVLITMLFNLRIKKRDSGRKPG